MCGIAGWLSPAGAVNSHILTAMNKKIAHRGPDADAVWFNDAATIGFTHRRLAIIDLQEASNQPLHDATGQYTLIFNGEIYNYKALRAELQTRGVIFRTEGDGEVLLEAYKAWGTDCLHRLHGMFAFALWDAPKQQLFAARDRFGKKPFFYALLPESAGGGLIFASEQQALAAHPQCARQINTTALGKYLTLGYSIGEETLWQGVKRLPAAHAMIFPLRGQPRQFEYWDLLAAYQNKRHYASDAVAAEQLRSLIDAATKARLQSDVPFGLFLSGGYDSNTVLASMAAILGGEKIHTFSIGFDDQRYDESDVAAASARYFKTQHTTIRLDPASISIDDILNHAGHEPLADVSFIPTYLLAKATAAHAKMVLTGDGGDELFAGYPTYVANAIHRVASPLLPTTVWRRLAGLCGNPLERRGLAYRLRQVLQGMTHDAAQAHVSWRVSYGQPVLQSVLGADVAGACDWESVYGEFDKHFQRAAMLQPLDRALYVDAKTWLVDSVLTKVDRATMAHGLEARSPLLDHQIAEFAAGLPCHMKLRLTASGFKTKWLLKQSQQARLPEFIKRQPKKGFSAPVASWFNNQMADYVRDAGASARSSGLLDRKGIERLVAQHIAGHADNGLLLLNIIVLQRFLDQSAA